MATQPNPAGCSNNKNKKRSASADDDFDSSALSSFKVVESRTSKKLKKQTASRRTTSNNNVLGPSTGDDCVFCGRACEGEDSIDCDQCGLAYHLRCCGLPQPHHENALIFLKLLHWRCDACRLAREDRIDSLEKIVKTQGTRIAALSNSLENCIAACKNHHRTDSLLATQAAGGPSAVSTRSEAGREVPGGWGGVGEEGQVAGEQRTEEQEPTGEAQGDMLPLTRCLDRKL